MIVVLGFIGFFLGSGLGVIRFIQSKAEAKLQKDAPTGRKRRVDMSEDAPEELTQAELKAMGKWFS